VGLDGSLAAVLLLLEEEEEGKRRSKSLEVEEEGEGLGELVEGAEKEAKGSMGLEVVGCMGEGAALNPNMSKLLGWMGGVSGTSKILGGLRSTSISAFKMSECDVKKILCECEIL
jgi:hypothetical protein